MAVTSVRLVDGVREMILLPRETVTITKLDVPFPDIRSAVEPRSDDDGDVDTTQYFGARAVTLEMELYVTPATLVDELASYLHPRARPYLCVVDDEWEGERQLELRIDQHGAPIEQGADDMYRECQVQWRAPDGIWEAVDPVTVTIHADSDSETVGIVFPVTFPIEFTATEVTGVTQVANTGGGPSHFIARLYGPCTAPSLLNETTGEEITFTSALTLGAGEYVEINTRTRTAYLLSDPAISRLRYLDFAVTTWWLIEAGDQQIRYAPASADAGADAVIEYRPSWF